MKIETNYVFDENDIRMIRTILPPNPCDKCSDKHGCCGCSDGIKYEELVKPFKKANVYNYCLKYNRIIEITKEAENLLKEQEKLIAEFKEIGIY